MQLSSLAYRGRVYAFEPAAVTFEYLLRNIRINQIDNVFLINLGLSDRNEELNLNYIDALSGCSFVLGKQDVTRPYEMASSVSERISCVTLDDWCASNNAPPIDFIKLDAEGMEQAALRGAAKLIQRDRPDLVIEFNPHTNDDFGHGSSRELYDLLAKSWEHIFIIPRSQGELIEVSDFDSLMGYVAAGPGWEDVFCTTSARQGVRANALVD